MEVRTIMTSDPACCSADTPVRRAAEMMVEYDCGEIPVVGADGKLTGVITDRDVSCRVVAQGMDPQQTKVQDVMTAPVISVTPDTSIDECERLMEQNQIRRVPVVDNDGTCCGIVAQADIALHVDEKETAAVVRDISRPGGAHSQTGGRVH